MNCKGCKWCTWACPNWMCMNPKHPDFEEDSDYPVSIELNDSCELFESGENDYTRFQKESSLSEIVIAR